MKPYNHFGKKLILSLLFANCTWPIATAQYTIPWAAQQPAWVFPVFFEEWGGEKDTLYLCYDPAAEEGIGGPDVIFGEQWLNIDTTKFNASFESFISYPTSAIKVLVYPDLPNAIYGDVLASGNVYFTSGSMSLKLKWDDTLFYDTIVPAPNLYPLPTTVAWLECGDFDPQNYWNCDIYMPWFLLPEDPLSYFPFTNHKYDSMIFYGDTTGPMSDVGLFNASLYIKPYAPLPPGINEKSNKNDYSFFPNPAFESISILTRQTGDYYYSITDVFGRNVAPLVLCNGPENNISVRDLPSGIYFFSIKTKQDVFVYKLLKQ